MGLSDHINISITVDTVGPAEPGFGIPLILSANASFLQRVRFYSDLPGVAADFADTSSPEYLAAQALLSANPKPSQIAIGKSLNKPTQVYVVGIAEVLASTKYYLRVRGQGVTPTDINITSGGSPTNDAIVAALVTALNAVVGKNYTAAATGSTGSEVITITASAAGDWFAIELLDSSGNPSSTAPAIYTIKQTHGDPGVAADLTAIEAENDSWYALYTLYNSQAYVTAVSAWVEANTKLYLAEVNESAAITTAAGNGDTLDALHTSNYARSIPMYHHSAAEMAGAAWFGSVLPTVPGGEDWKWHTLEGPTPSNLTETHRTNLLGRQANAYQLVGGEGMTWEGTCADGEFIDTIRGRDWTEATMQIDVYQVFRNQAARGSKVPYTDAGVAMIEAAVRAVLKEGVTNDVYVDGSIVVTAPLVASQSGGDKSNRILRNLKWSAEFAGSIHELFANGTVSF